jgi:hypothetical protein
MDIWSLGVMLYGQLYEKIKDFEEYHVDKKNESNIYEELKNYSLSFTEEDNHIERVIKAIFPRIFFVTFSKKKKKLFKNLNNDALI